MVGFRTQGQLYAVKKAVDCSSFSFLQVSPFGSKTKRKSKDLK